MPIKKLTFEKKLELKKYAEIHGVTNAAKKLGLSRPWASNVINDYVRKPANIGSKNKCPITGFNL